MLVARSAAAWAASMLAAAAAQPRPLDTALAERAANSLVSATYISNGLEQRAEASLHFLLILLRQAVYRGGRRVGHGC